MGLTQVAHASPVAIGETGYTFDTQGIIADSITTSGSLNENGVLTSEHYMGATSFNPDTIGSFEEIIMYLETDQLMNPDVTMTFSDDNKITNNDGFDGMIFMVVPTNAQSIEDDRWGATISLNINNQFLDIFADTLVGTTNDGSSNNVYADLFDLSDFGIAVGDSITSFTIFSAAENNRTNYFQWLNGNLATSERYGNYSDVLFAGGGAISAVPIPELPLLCSRQRY